MASRTVSAGRPVECQTSTTASGTTTPSRYNHPEDQLVVSNPAADGSPARANTQSRTGTITSY